MRKDNEQDLLIVKFRSSPKEKQDQLLKFLFTDNISVDNVIDFLNNKKLSNSSKNFGDGDIIMIDPYSINTYPEVNIEYYKENKLLINNQYIQTKVEYISPITNNPFLWLCLKNKTGKQLVEVYTHYIDDQKSFDVII